MLNEDLKKTHTPRRGGCRTKAAFTQQSWHFLNAFEGRLEMRDAWAG
jgi:hypothetical protein